MSPQFGKPLRYNRIDTRTTNVSPSVRTVMAAAIALGMYSTVCVAPRASANPQGVPCGVLDQVHQSLDDDVTGGIDGVRQVIGTLYIDGIAHKRDADAKLAMVSDGIHHIQDINNGHPVPGLAGPLHNLERAASDMKTAVTGLFQPAPPQFQSVFGVSEPSYSFTVPQPSTWETIDFADQQKNDVYGVVNKLHGQCSP